MAGGSTGTGALVASLARTEGRDVRVIDAPERAGDQSLVAAIAGVDAIVLVPARGVQSVAAQVQAVLAARADIGTDMPHVVLVSGFSVGHGAAHALNTSRRLADLVAAEALVRAGGTPYTIVRPTRLIGDPPGRYALTLTQDPWADGMIARADLARVCLAAVSEPGAREDVRGPRRTGIRSDPVGPAVRRARDRRGAGSVNAQHAWESTYVADELGRPSPRHFIVS